jgi:hypothetical protein
MIGEKHQLRDSMTLEEATVSNMWQMAAVVDVLERKGFCTKQDLYDIITEFRRKNPHASVPETASHEPYLLNETENKIIVDLLELLKKPGLIISELREVRTHLAARGGPCSKRSHWHSPSPVRVN